MSYPILVSRRAQRVYDLLKDSTPPTWGEFVEQRGAGDLRNYDEIEALVEPLLGEFEFPLSRGAGAQYEGRVGILLHETILDTQAVSDPDFWRWVSFRPLLKATLYRHMSDKNEMPKPANFGLGSRIENFSYRAWLRAEIGFDQDAPMMSRYSLAVRGDQDLWRSHLFRVRYSFNRQMAHALIQFQYPDEDSDGLLKKGDKDDGIRLLAKRLQRTQANMAYAMLSKEQCLCLISELANGLTKVDGTKYSKTGSG